MPKESVMALLAASACSPVQWARISSRTTTPWLARWATPASGQPEL